MTSHAEEITLAEDEDAGSSGQLSAAEADQEGDHRDNSTPDRSGCSKLERTKIKRLPPAGAFGPAKMAATDFRSDSGKRDVVLKADGGDLYCDRALLVMWSEVFKSKLNSKEFKGKKRCELQLEDRNVDQIEEILYIIYPPNRPINDDNVKVALELSKEYDMKEVKRRCELFLQSQRVSPDNLLIAQDYDLPGLKRKCIETLKTKRYSDLEKDEQFIEKIRSDIHVQLLHERIAYLENKIEQSNRRDELDKSRFDEVVDLFGELQVAVSAKIQNKKRQEQVVDVCDDVLELLRKYDTAVSNSSPKSPPRDGATKSGGWK